MQQFQKHDDLDEILNDRAEHKKISRCAFLVLILYGPLFCYFFIIACLIPLVITKSDGWLTTTFVLALVWALPIVTGYTIIRVCCGNWRGKYKQCITTAFIPVVFYIAIFGFWYLALKLSR